MLLWLALVGTDGEGMMRAALYARLSSSDDPENLEQQISRGRAYALERGWEVVGEFVEPRQSGFHESAGGRPQFRRLLTLVEAGQVGVVVVRHTDRLYRDAAKALAFSQLCAIATYSQGIDTTQGQRLPFGMAALLAEEESRVKSDRQKAFRERAKAAGRPRIGGSRAWGWQPDGVTPREDEQRIIRESVSAIAAGASPRSVRRAWEAAGLVSRNGTLVKQNTIRGVLLRAEEYGVDPDVARRVSDILQDPSRRQNRSGENRRRFVLNGLTFCAECSRPMYGTRATRARTPYYRCSGSDGGCGVTSIQAAKLEDEVWQRVFVEGREATATPAVPDDAGGVAELQARLEVLEARAANFRRDYALGEIDAQTLNVALAVVDAQADDVRRELAQAARAEAATFGRHIGWYLRMVEGPTDFDEARPLLRAVVERIDVRKTNRNPRIPAAERITVTWR